MHNQPPDYALKTTTFNRDPQVWGLGGTKYGAAASRCGFGATVVGVPTYLPPSAESPVAICESPSCTTEATSAPSRVNTLPRAIARPPALDATCCE